MSGSAIMSAPTRSRTSRLRHRKPVLYPAELWTHTEAPTGIEPAASWVEARSSVRLSYGAEKGIHGWPGRSRTGRLPPCREGALPLSYRPLAAVPGFEPGPTEVTTRRATVLRHAAVGGEKGFEHSAGAPAPTYLVSNQAPSARPGYLSVGGGGRASRTLMPTRRLDRVPFSETVAPANGRSLLMNAIRLVQTGSNRRLPRCGRGALPLSYGPMTAARVMPCRGGGARSITRPSEPSDRRETYGTRGRTRTSDC